MPDETFYPDESTLQEFGWRNRQPKGTVARGPRCKPQYSIDGLLAFDGDSPAALHRAIVCSCYAGRRCSVTARQTDHVATKMIEPPPQIVRPDSERYGWPASLPRWP